MKEIPQNAWKGLPGSIGVLRVFKDDRFLVQISMVGSSMKLSVNCIEFTILNGKPIWKEGISWDDLQDVKNKCGFEDCWLCEYYPPHSKVVNVANIRHLWVLKQEPCDILKG